MNLALKPFWRTARAIALVPIVPKEQSLWLLLLPGILIILFYVFIFTWGWKRLWDRMRGPKDPEEQRMEDDAEARWLDEWAEEQKRKKEAKRKKRGKRK